MPKPADVPECPSVPAVRTTGRETREYAIRLITPLFGGGVIPGEPDPTMPIRATSIRGHLQFWWRATRGANRTTRDELFTRHAEVWGRTEHASPVEVEVSDVQTDTPKPCLKYSPRNDGKLQPNWEAPFNNKGCALPYALFPFQGQLTNDRRQVEKTPAQFIENGSFTLRIRYPELLRQEVETAVWAWVNFGGLGARTRRGCGALFCKNLAPGDVSTVQDWFRSTAGKNRMEMREWPTIPDRFFMNPNVGAPVTIWDRLTALWRDFRQGQGFARNPGERNRPGRSRYPEPETIRRVTGRRSGLHARLAHIPDDAFPRAELGLPIVFHFQGQGEPPDTVLYPASDLDGKRRERMASPLILKPLALANGHAVALIMRLVNPRLAGLDLRQGDTSLPLPGTMVIQDGKLATYRDSPLAGAASGSALDAFLALALDRSKGFQEVTR